MIKYTVSGFADEIDKMMCNQYPLLHRLGIDNIELRGVNGVNISKLEADEVKALKSELDSEHMHISAIGSPIGKIKLDDDFDAHLATLEKLLGFADILETKYIRVFSFFTDSYGEDVKDKVFSYTERMVQAAQRAGKVLLHENEKGIYGDIPERCKELMSRFYGENYRCTFDFANFIQCHADTTKAYELLNPYIEYFHIKDALAENGHIVPAGQGDGNIKALLKRAFDNGYSGYLSLEPHLFDFPGLSDLEDNHADKKSGVSGPICFEAAYNALAKILETL